MADAGGKEASPDLIEQLREALVPHLLNHLSGPEPTAPQYQSQSFSPVQAFAAARNPQAAGLINQQVQAPAQAQYAQQQAEFEKAMGLRQQATQAAVSLIGQQSRNRPSIRENTIIGKDGKPYRVREIVDNATGEILNQDVIGEAPESKAFLPSTEGYFPAGKQTGQITGGPRQAPNGGGTIYPPPPAGMVQSVAASTATLGGLEDLRTAYKKIREQTIGQRTIGKVVRQYAGESRLGGALAPEYANYTAARRAALNAYIKGQTGAQFSVQELQRYEAQYPEPWDPEDVAENKIKVLEQRALSDMHAKLRSFPGASGAAPQQETAEQRKARLRVKYGIAQP